jgi:hypothetical protein
MRIFVDLSIPVDPGIAENAAIAKDQGVASHLGVIGKMGTFEDIRHSASGLIPLSRAICNGSFIG